jgi:8-oxo-dGTP pyrophosphatase MutT (NUDIX family)
VQQICEEHRQRGQRVENLPLYRFFEFAQDEHGLHLWVGQVSYEEYLGLGVLRHLQAPLVLAVAAATEVGGQLVLERRSARVAQGVGLLHVKPSGHIHPPATPWQALQQEAWEELALQPAEIEQARLLALVRSHTANCVSLIYGLQTSLSWPALSGRHPVDAWESDELLGLGVDSPSLCRWLEQEGERSTGPCQATVERYLHWRYPPV